MNTVKQLLNDDGEFYLRLHFEVSRQEFHSVIRSIPSNIQILACNIHSTTLSALESPISTNLLDLLHKNAQIILLEVVWSKSQLQLVNMDQYV